MVYSVNFNKHALKELAKINEPFYSNIKQAIYNLALNPRPQGYKKLKGRDGYRIRVGNYRIIYDIFDYELLVDIIALGHRKDIYEE
jgi:mRNA interferase RelE/StbE